MIKLIVIKQEIGKIINEELDGILFSNSSIKRKEQIKSLEELKVGVKFDKETIFVDPSVLFSVLLLMIERELRMIEYFHYELTPVPTSLFEDGMMRKSVRSILMKELQKMYQVTHLMYLQYTFWMVEHCYAKLNESQTLPFIMLFFNVVNI